MLTIVGLGNPGPSYEGTRHNVGFRVVEGFAVRWGHAQWKTKFDCRYQVFRKKGAEILTAMPQGYVNLSGQTLLPLLRYHRVSEDELLVVHDDLDLKPGVLRFKRGGGDGGHKGVADLTRSLGSSDYCRLRVGIGHPRDRSGEDSPASTSPNMVSSWVLGRPVGDEKALIDAALERAIEALELYVESGLEKVQMVYNGRD